MQLLKVPFTHDAMSSSVSMTGVTILTNNQFKSRLSGSKEIILHPSKGIISRRVDIDEIERLKKQKKKSKKVSPNSVNPTIVKKSVKSFVINKKEVTHRIRGYLNQMSGFKQLYFWTVTFP